MSSKQISPLLRTWYRWKAMRLPWRKRFLVGLDLHGNTFWEFRDVRGADKEGRWRRIVQYPAKTVHYDRVRVSPQWHQWLRHTRKNPPSIEEQQQDVMRQQGILVLAAEADARWAAKESLLEQPASAQAGGGAKPVEGKDQVRSPFDTEADKSLRPETGWTAKTAQGGATEAQDQKTPAPADDPWKQARGGPSESWQPGAWTPPASKR